MISDYTAKDGEPVFLLFASDPFCLHVLRLYRTLLADAGQEEHCETITEMMKEAREWRERQAIHSADSEV